MTKYVCAECGADAVTVSADGITLPETAEFVIPDVTHCSNPGCANSDPKRASASDFVAAG